MIPLHERPGFRELYESGAGYVKICETFRVKSHTITYAAKKLGIYRTPKPSVDFNNCLLDMIKRLENGHSINSVADTYGINPTTLNNRLKKAGYDRFAVKQSMSPDPGIGRPFQIMPAGHPISWGCVTGDDRPWPKSV